LLVTAIEANGALETLATDTRAALATEEGILGRPGIVTVEVGGGKILDQMQFNKQGHGFSP
jgi:hypothetical protein